MQVYDDDDLHEGQRSSEIKCEVYDDDDLHEGQRSSEIKCGNYVIWLPNLVRRNPGASLR